MEQRVAFLICGQTERRAVLAVLDPHPDLVRELHDPQQKAGDQLKDGNAGGARQQEDVEEGDEGRDRPAEKQQKEYPKDAEYYPDSRRHISVRKRITKQL